MIEHPPREYKGRNDASSVVGEFADVLIFCPKPTHSHRSILLLITFAYNSS